MNESNFSSYSCSAQFSGSTELCSFIKITVCDDYSSSDMVGIHCWNKGFCFIPILLDYLVGFGLNGSLQDVRYPSLYSSGLHSSEMLRSPRGIPFGLCDAGTWEW
jgi:hypothetical protein